MRTEYSRYLGVAGGPQESFLLVVAEGVRRQADKPGRLGDSPGHGRGVDGGEAARSGRMETVSFAG